MSLIPQSTSYQEIQRAFLAVEEELNRLKGGTSASASIRMPGGAVMRHGVSSKTTTPPSGETTTPPAVTTSKGRMYASATTAALAQGETDLVEIELTESADIISISTNIPAWVRVYNNAASREADLGRSYRQDPTPGTGLMVEVMTFSPEGLLIYLSPVPFWNNCDVDLGKTAYLTVTRSEPGVAEEVVIDFEILPQEDLDHGGPQGKPGETGPPGLGFEWKDEWEATKVYGFMNVANYAGSSYVSLAPDNVGNTPGVSPTFWALMAEKGDQGEQGVQGVKGDKGDQGDSGTNGAGVPSGGSAGQWLRKKTATDFDAEWASAPSGGGGAQPDYIAGLVPKWESSTSISVGAGAAYIESSAAVLSSTSTITKSSLSLSASAWYHLYFFSNSGTPDVEVSTTGPESTPYAGTARSHDTNTAKRYIGSIRTDASGNILPFEAIAVGNSLEINPGGLRLVNGSTDEQVTNTVDASLALFSEAVDSLLLSFTIQSQAIFMTVKIHTDNGITTRAQCNHQEAIGLSGYTAYSDYVFPRKLKRTPGSTSLYWWRRTWSGTTGGALYIDVPAIGLLR